MRVVDNLAGRATSHGSASAGQLFGGFIGFMLVGIAVLALMSFSSDRHVPAPLPSPVVTSPGTASPGTVGHGMGWVERQVAKNSRQRPKERTQSGGALSGPASAPATTPAPATGAQLQALQPFLGTWQAQFGASRMTMRFYNDGGYPTCEAITKSPNADVDIDLPLSDYAVAGNVLTWRGARFELRNGGTVLHATYPPNQATMTELDWTRV